MTIFSRLFALRSVRILLTSALLGLAAPGVFAATYFVDQNHPQANDSNAGSEDKPWKTLYRAAKHALQPGDTVLVKKGVYEATEGADWRKAAIRPSASGEPGKPITFRSFPRHAAVLDNKGLMGTPAIGTYGHDHITIDGFEIKNAGDRGISVFGTSNRRVRGVVVQNNIISGVRHPTSDNAEAVRLEYSTHTIVRNNKMHDITNAGRSTNATGVKLYWSDNAIIENNEIFDTISGIKEKENGEFIHIRRNYIHDCSVGVEIMNQNYPTTQGYRVYENVIHRCNTAVDSKNVSTATMKDIFIYNNVFSEYGHKAVNGTQHGHNRRIWNNIFYRSGSVNPADFYTINDPPTEITLMDYNLFYQQPKMIIGIYSTKRVYSDLASWQKSGYGLDQNSLVGDPMFVDPANGDFRLRSGSPALKRGRADGKSSSGLVNIGAYTLGTERIGVQWEGTPLPAAPSNLKVE